MITKIKFYIKVKVRSSKLCCKGIPLIIIIVVIVIGIPITALKIGDILIYSSVPFVFYIVYRPTSRFTVYKVLFTLIAVLTARGVAVLTVRGVAVLTISIV